MNDKRLCILLICYLAFFKSGPIKGRPPPSLIYVFEEGSRSLGDVSPGLSLSFLCSYTPERLEP